MEQIVKQTRKQKLFFGLGSFLYITFILGIIVFLNIISIHHYKRFDVTHTRIYSLSDKSKQILDNLKDTVSVIQM